MEENRYLTIPVGFVAVELGSYEKLITDAAVLKLEKQRNVIESKQAAMTILDLREEIAYLKARQHKLDAFFEAEPYARKMLSEFEESFAKEDEIYAAPEES